MTLDELLDMVNLTDSEYLKKYKKIKNPNIVKCANRFFKKASLVVLDISSKPENDVSKQFLKKFTDFLNTINSINQINTLDTFVRENPIPKELEDVVKKSMQDINETPRWRGGIGDDDDDDDDDYKITPDKIVMAPIFAAVFSPTIILGFIGAGFAYLCKKRYKYKPKFFNYITCPIAYFSLGFAVVWEMRIGSTTGDITCFIEENFTGTSFAEDHLGAYNQMEDARQMREAREDASREQIEPVKTDAHVTPPVGSFVDSSENNEKLPVASLIAYSSEIDKNLQVASPFSAFR